MTFERMIVVGLEDIAAISLECNKCRQRITFGPDARPSIPHTCSCGHTLIPSDELISFNSKDSLLGVFLQVVERIRTVNKTNPFGVRILLEYKDPD